MIQLNEKQKKIDFIRENFERMESKEIAARLGCTIATVQRYAKEMHLKRVKSVPKYKIPNYRYASDEKPKFERPPAIYSNKKFY